jgi:uncharacterized NAD-dependent epimerase/dehydratase family protein
MKKAPAIVLTNGMLDSDNAKTCHGLLRGTERFKVLAVIDKSYPGQDAGTVMDGKPLGIPIYASVNDYFAAGNEQPEFCVVGVALPGGLLPGDFRSELRDAMLHNCSLVNGLHTFLSEDMEFDTLAKEKGLRLIDIRKPRPRSELSFWNGSIFEVKTPRIAVLGMDCAIGKRTTCRFLMETCREHGIKAEMIFTGQTGWMQGYPHGFIFDSTVNDFISGEIERVIVECDREQQPDLILVEGQSALRNPTGPCGSEFLMSGQVKGVVLQHAPGREFHEGTEHVGCLIPDVASEIQLIGMYGAEVLGITLNEMGQTDEEMAAHQRRLEERLGIPVLRPLKEGVERLLPVIRAFIAKNQG